MVGTTVGPFAQQGLDEAFGFAVGAGSIGSCPDVAQSHGLTGLGEAMRDVAGAVIRQQALDTNSSGGEPGNRSSQEGGRARCSLIFQNLRVSETGSVIDGNVDELPTDTSSALDSVSGDAMADPTDPAELLDVEVKELTGMLTLVASDGLLWVQSLEPGESVAGQYPCDRGRTDWHTPRDLDAGQPSSSPSEDLLFPPVVGLARHPVGPRAPIQEACLSLRSVSRQPFEGGPTRDPRRFRRDRYGRTRTNAAHQKHSTGWTASGILVDVHLGPPREAVTSDITSLTDGGPDGQLSQ